MVRTEVITSLMTLLERMASAAPDPGAVVEDLSEFFGPVLFQALGTAAKPAAQQTESPLVAVCFRSEGPARLNPCVWCIQADLRGTKLMPDKQYNQPNGFQWHCHGCRRCTACR